MHRPKKPSVLVRDANLLRIAIIVFYTIVVRVMAMKAIEAKRRAACAATLYP